MAKKVLSQHDRIIQTSMTIPEAGFFGFGAKSDGLYQCSAEGVEYRLLTVEDAAFYATTTQGTKADLALPTLSFTSEAVMAKLLTGFISGSGAVTATDTLIQGISKINGNILLKASLDSPTFTGSVKFPSNQNINGVVLSVVAGPNKFLSGDGIYKEVIINGAPVVSDATKSLLLSQSALDTQNQTNFVTLINNTWN